MTYFNPIGSTDFLAQRVYKVMQGYNGALEAALRLDPEDFRDLPERLRRSLSCMADEIYGLRPVGGPLDEDDGEPLRDALP